MYVCDICKDISLPATSYTLKLIKNDVTIKEITFDACNLHTNKIKDDLEVIIRNYDKYQHII